MSMKELSVYHSVRRDVEVGEAWDDKTPASLRCP